MEFGFLDQQAHHHCDCAQKTAMCVGVYGKLVHARSCKLATQQYICGAKTKISIARTKDGPDKIFWKKTCFETFSFSSIFSCNTIYGAM